MPPNSNESSHPVGRLKPNPWGLYDIAGNVWEFCHDGFDPTFYAKSPSRDPIAPKTGMGVVRGGSWNGQGGSCRAANRGYNGLEFRGSMAGFRVVCEVRPAGK